VFDFENTRRLRLGWWIAAIQPCFLRSYWSMLNEASSRLVLSDISRVSNRKDYSRSCRRDRFAPWHSSSGCLVSRVMWAALSDKAQEIRVLLVELWRTVIWFQHLNKSLSLLRVQWTFHLRWLGAPVPSRAALHRIRDPCRSWHEPKHVKTTILYAWTWQNCLIDASITNTLLSIWLASFQADVDFSRLEHD